MSNFEDLMVEQAVQPTCHAGSLDGHAAIAPRGLRAARSSCTRNDGCFQHSISALGVARAVQSSPACKFAPPTPGTGPARTFCSTKREGEFPRNAALRAPQA